MSDHATPDNPPTLPREFWGVWWPDAGPDGRGHWLVGAFFSVREAAEQAAETQNRTIREYEALRGGAPPLCAELVPTLAAIHPGYRTHLRALLAAAQAVLSGDGQEDAARRRLREAAREAGEFDDNGGR